MNHPPAILKNKSDRTVEFRYGGELHIFKPGEEKFVNGEVAHHALYVTNTKLLDVTSTKLNQEEKHEMTAQEHEVAQNVPFEQMKWIELVKQGSALGVYKPGMSRQQLTEKLKGKPF
jgi:hypothetical protein